MKDMDESVASDIDLEWADKIIITALSDFDERISALEMLFDVCDRPDLLKGCGVKQDKMIFERDK